MSKNSSELFPNFHFVTILSPPPPTQLLGVYQDIVSGCEAYLPVLNWGTLGYPPFLPFTMVEVLWTQCKSIFPVYPFLLLNWRGEGGVELHFPKRIGHNVRITVLASSDVGMQVPMLALISIVHKLFPTVLESSITWVRLDLNLY